MLEGRKPLAAFKDGYPFPWFDDLVARFAPWVEAKRLVARTILHPFDEPRRIHDGTLVEGTRENYFALPGEEWRIDAHLMLMRIGSRTGWTDALERYQGALLGYEDWQTDWWLARGWNWQRAGR